MEIQYKQSKTAQLPLSKRLHFNLDALSAPLIVLPDWEFQLYISYILDSTR